MVMGSRKSILPVGNIVGNCVCEIKKGLQKLCNPLVILG